MPMREQLEQLVHEMVTRGIRYDEAQREFEKKFIIQVLLKADGNLGKAADLLGIHRNTLARKMNEYRLRRSA
ncbi:MAG TPA: helix-turn-helix domain-containing protein [Vicinamibacterales bacterium]|jgi:Fis family transcriptional regulator, factor for inversion stimulation protein|nr:helix-turn-helix domain-containing protein [Vicinamibacterales bacterium]